MERIFLFQQQLGTQMKYSECTWTPLYTNNDTDSNKENIPPINQYPMPSNTRSAKWQTLNHIPLQEITISPDPNDIIVIRSPKPTSESTTSTTLNVLIKRTRNCLLCRLLYVYNHIAWCQELTDGYTCHCHKKTLTRIHHPNNFECPY